MKTKRLIARIMCVLMLALLSASLLTVPAFADVVGPEEITNGKDTKWAETADLSEVKSELDSLQKYLLPLDDFDNYEYYVSKVLGGGSETEGYTPRMTYVIETEKKDPDRIMPTLTITRVDLTLPDLSVLDSCATAGYSAHTLKYATWDDLWDTNLDYEHPITSVGGYPAKGSWYSCKNTQGYDMYGIDSQVDLRQFLPWANDRDPIICFSISATHEDVGFAAEVGNTILSWQPTLSEPVVISADTDVDAPNGGSEEGKDGLNVVVDTPAKEEAGEDGGTTIPAIVVLGTLGVAAAAAAAAAYTADTGYETKPSHFKMYINKNFGDTLKKGCEPQGVFARICEIKPGGAEVERLDLTRQIQVLTDNSLNIVDGGMSDNGYRCAEVSVPDVEKPESEGRVTFFFEGEGGSFTQNVVFKVLGDSAITFPEQEPEDAVFIKKGILGDGQSYRISFEPENFLNEPTDIRITSPSSDIAVSYIKYKKTGNYYAIVENKTAGVEVESKHYDATESYGEYTVLSTKPFAEMISADIHIFAANNEEKAEADFRIEFYPEGISVKVLKGKVEDGKLLINTKDENGVFEPVELQFIRASGYRSGAVVDDDVDVDPELSYTEGKQDSESINVLYGFKHTVTRFTHEEMKAYRLMPEVAVPDNGHDCYTFRWAATAVSQGHELKLDIPVRLTGEKLDLSPVEERNKEIALLKRAVERYGLHGDARSIELTNHLETLPASVIKQMRAQVLKCSIEYYSNEARKEENFAAFMSAGMYSCVVIDWLGQQAFSYIVKVYAGDVAEMLVTPLKNAIITAAADNLQSFIWSEPYKDHFTYEKIVGIFEEMAENFLIDAMFGDLDWSDISKAGTEGLKLLKNFSMDNAKSALLRVFGADYTDKLRKGACFCAAFAALNFTKHYTMDDDTKDDIGKSIMATFNDCTMNTLKQIFSKFVSSWLTKKFSLSEGADGNIEGSDNYTFAPLEKYIKSKLTVGDIRIFGRQLTGTEFVAFGKTYNFFQTSGDSTGTLVGVGVDAVTGEIIDKAPDAIAGVWKMAWDSAAGCFIIGLGNKLYALTLKGFVDAAFKQITECFEVEKVAVSTVRPIPSFIPPIEA